MTKEYIEKQRLIEWLEVNVKSTQQIIDEYKSFGGKIGTVADGSKVGYLIACQGMLNYITATDLFNSHTVTIKETDDENCEIQSRIDFATQFRYFVKDKLCYNSKPFSDYIIVSEYLDKWLEEVAKGD